MTGDVRQPRCDHPAISTEQLSASLNHTLLSLAALSVAQIIDRLFMGYLVHNGLETMCLERLGTQFAVEPRNSPERSARNYKNVASTSNLRAEKEAGITFIQPRRSVSIILTEGSDQYGVTL